MFFDQVTIQLRPAIGARISSSFLLSIFLGACQISDRTSAADYDSVPNHRLQQAAEQYCQDDARETAEYLLTQGTPDDVQIMEEAIVMLDNGEWLVFAEPQGPAELIPTADSLHAGADGTVWLMALSCRWQTPLTDLNGQYEFELEVLLSADGAASALRRPAVNQ